MPLRREQVLKLAKAVVRQMENEALNTTPGNAYDGAVHSLKKRVVSDGEFMRALDGEAIFTRIGKYTLAWKPQGLVIVKARVRRGAPSIYVRF